MSAWPPALAEEVGLPVAVADGVDRTGRVTAGFGLTDLIVAAAFVGMATGLAVPMVGTLVATPAQLDGTAPRLERLPDGLPGQPGRDAAPGGRGIPAGAGARHEISEPTAAATEPPSPGGRH